MSLTTIMSNAGLSWFAEIALLLFVFAFVVIVWRLYRPSRKQTLEKQAMLPLNDEPDSTPRRRRDDERP
jgi:cbb3-type cytochrome oxidase subunit 3